MSGDTRQTKLTAAQTNGQGPAPTLYPSNPLCPQSKNEWPVIGDAAFYGLAGDVVEALSSEGARPILPCLPRLLTTSHATTCDVACDFPGRLTLFNQARRHAVMRVEVT